MFIVGVAMVSWVTRTPAVRDAVGASTVQMGLILLGVSAGSMAGVLWSARLVSRIGTRPVILLGGASVIAGLAVIGVGQGTSGPCALLVYRQGRRYPVDQRVDPDASSNRPSSNFKVRMRATA